MSLYYNLDSEQARYFAGLKSGKTMVTVAPLKEQPPEGYCYLDDNNNSIAFMNNTPATMDIWSTLFSYPLNARVGLRETYTFTNSDDDKKIYIYKSDKSREEEELLRKIFGNAWHSAQSMPVEAIRHWGIVTGVRVDRVQGIIDKDWFNGRYSTPRPRYKNGEIVGYEALCWDEESAELLVKSKGKYGTSELGWDFWGDNVLSILINPWCEIFTVRKE